MVSHQRFKTSQGPMVTKIFLAFYMQATMSSAFWVKYQSYSCTQGASHVARCMEQVMIWMQVIPDKSSCSRTIKATRSPSCWRGSKNVMGFLWGHGMVPWCLKMGTLKGECPGWRTSFFHSWGACQQSNQTETRQTEGSKKEPIMRRNGD